MKSIHLAAFPCVVASFVVVGCSQPTPPADSVAPQTQKPELESVAKRETAKLEDGVMFSLDPANVYACKGRDRTETLVKWDVQRPEVKFVKVLVSDKTNTEKKTLAVMSPKGEAKTGPWAIDGLKVELVDGDTGKLLAEQTVTALPCN